MEVRVRLGLGMFMSRLTIEKQKLPTEFEKYVV